MAESQIYILIGILALAVTAAVVIFVRGRKPGEKMTKLAQLAFVFIFAGILFGEDRFIGYGLMTVGGLLALADIIKKIKK
jgi:hypothetical protein